MAAITATEVATATSHTIGDAFTEIAAQLRRSTVQVRGDGAGGGSGVIWSSDGTIITNAHVAHDATAQVELWDGRVFAARVVARDTQRDLALLKIDAQDLPAATSADSDKLRVGELVLAIGNPLGIVGAVAMGIVHAVGTLGPGRQEWVSADIRLAPGNSGGPLVNAHGHVIGINSMIAGGLGLAVPSNDIQAFLQSQQQRPLFGVTLQQVQLGAGKLGLLVLEVASASAAESAGLILGDVLTGVGGTAFSQPEDLVRAWRKTRTGEALVLDLLRGGQPRQLIVRAALPETVAA